MLLHPRRCTTLWNGIILFCTLHSQALQTRRERMMRIFILALLMTCIPFASNGAPKPEHDPSLKDWFESLTDNSGRSCCGLGDGHRVQYRVSRSSQYDYEFEWNGEWYQIPNEKVVHNHANPTGSAIAFFTEVHGMFIYCFIRPVEA